MNFLGFVIHPIPLGALNPRLWRTTLLKEVRAAILFEIDGMRKPNFIYTSFFSHNGHRFIASPKKTPTFSLTQVLHTKCPFSQTEPPFMSFDFPHFTQDLSIFFF